MNDYIEIKGAREHNLKNIDISIPKNKLTVDRTVRLGQIVFGV